jgi:hypothetical protein
MRNQEENHGDKKVNARSAGTTTSHTYERPTRRTTATARERPRTRTELHTYASPIE